MIKTKVTLTSKVPRLKSKMKLASEVVRKTAGDIAAQAELIAFQKDIHDTGHLIGSINAQPTGELSAEVAVGAEYAVYHEFGTYKMAARPFFFPAVERVRPSFEAAMRQLTKVK
jgi:HK97 gp10 family phage protein